MDLCQPCSDRTLAHTLAAESLGEKVGMAMLVAILCNECFVGVSAGMAGMDETASTDGEPTNSDTVPPIPEEEAETTNIGFYL